MTSLPWGPLLRSFALFVVGLVVVAQAVPYGRDHHNPPIVSEPAWDQPSTRALAVRACFDCHSNETRWPWYSRVAPGSWLIQSQVDDGRRALNLSQWNSAYGDAHEASETVLDRSMPPRAYMLLHPQARLGEAERTQLARGFDATFDVTLSVDSDE